VIDRIEANLKWLEKMLQEMAAREYRQIPQSSRPSPEAAS
jgi:hypothetical protein